MKAYAFYLYDELVGVYQSPITAMRALLNHKDVSDAILTSIEGRLSTNGYCKLMELEYEWYVSAEIYEVDYFPKK